MFLHGWTIILPEQFPRDSFPSPFAFYANVTTLRSLCVISRLSVVCDVVARYQKVELFVNTFAPSIAQISDSLY